MLKVLRSTLERVSSVGIWNNTQPSAMISSKIDSALDLGINLPEKPKRPPNPWLIFCRERRDEVMRQNSNFKVSDVASALSREWKNIDKSKYEEEFNHRQEQYLKQLEDYERSLTDEQRDYRVEKKELEREAKYHRMIVKLKPPKLPRNSANLYVNVMCKRPEIQEKMVYSKPNEVLKFLFEEYRSLSDQEKAKYDDMRQVDIARFEREFDAWYANVIDDPKLTKAVKAIATNMRDRFRKLKYIS